MYNERFEGLNMIPASEDPEKPKQPIGSWAIWQSKKYPQERLKNAKKLGVICGKISNNLVMVDLDFKKGENTKEKMEGILNDLKEEFGMLINTYFEQTPHGIHLYFFIKDKNYHIKTTENKNAGYRKNKENYTFRPINKTKYHKILDGVDIRGEGGFSVIAPTQYGRAKYKIANDKPIKEITVEEYENLLAFLLDVEESKIPQYQLDFLNGKNELHAYAAKHGVEELVLIKSLLLDCYYFLGVKPEELYEGLEANQPNFNREITEEQLQYPYHNITNGYYTNKKGEKVELKPLSKEKRREYYPGYFKKSFDFDLEEPTEEEIEDLNIKEITDLIANELLHEFHIITLNDTRQILLQDNIAYTHKTDKLIQRLKHKIDEIPKGSYKTIKSNVIELIKDETLIDREDLCYARYLIPFENGIYNTKTQTFKLKDTITDKTEPYFFYEIPHPYLKGNYDCPKFKSALDNWLGKDNKVKNKDVFEMIGLCLTMNTEFKHFFVNYAEPHHGKSQFTNILTALIGRNNMSAISIQRLNKRFGTMNLPFKILNLHPDLPNEKLYDVGIIKACTGDDELIPSEIKGGKQFHFKNTAKFWFNANEIPEMENVQDQAFFERAILIYFATSFTMQKGNRINNFSHTITKDNREMQGIIHESIKGYIRLLERGEFRNEILENTAHIWQYQSSPLYRFMLDTLKCTHNPNDFIDSDIVLKAYNNSLISIGENGITKNHLTRELQKYNIPHNQRKINGKNTWCYVGITFKNPDAIDANVLKTKKNDISNILDSITCK